MFELGWKLHKWLGFRGWDSPRGFELRFWVFWLWNEYDDYLYNGVHGFRLFGFEFDTQPRWLDRLCWKLLPVMRFFNRREEQVLD